MCIEYLLWLIPIGLLLDIVGFLVVIRYGHALFLRTGVGPPDPKWKDGDVYWQIADDDPVKVALWDARRRLKAHIGVGLVVLGFVMQIVGSVVSMQVR